MTIQPAQIPHTQDAGADALSRSWQRLLALSGAAFAPLFVVGWFTRVSAFLMLLAGFVFLYFIGAIRSVLGSAESPVRGSAQLARVAFGGGLIGVAGMAMASVTLAAASSDGSDVDPW